MFRLQLRFRSRLGNCFDRPFSGPFGSRNLCKMHGEASRRCTKVQAENRRYLFQPFSGQTRSVSDRSEEAGAHGGLGGGGGGARPGALELRLGVAGCGVRVGFRGPSKPETRELYPCLPCASVSVEGPKAKLLNLTHCTLFYRGPVLDGPPFRGGGENESVEFALHMGPAPNRMHDQGEHSWAAATFASTRT